MRKYSFFFFVAELPDIFYTDFKRNQSVNRETNRKKKKIDFLILSGSLTQKSGILINQKKKLTNHFMQAANFLNLLLYYKKEATL